MRNLVDIVRVDDQRLLEILGGAREARQNKNAGISVVLGGDILFRDEIHSVAQRRDEANPTCTVKSGQRVAFDRSVNITHRRPVEVAELSIDCPRQRFKFVTDIDIGLQIIAGWRRDLYQARGLAFVGIHFEQASEGPEFFWQALAIIQAIDTDDG